MKRRILVGFAAFLVFVGAVFVFEYFVYPNLASTNAPCANKAENGLWLRYLWYFGKKTPADEAVTAQLLQRAQIKYAYFHVFDVTVDGKLRYKKLTEGRHLVETFHKLAPSVRLVAWVSVGDYYPAHGTDFGNPQTIPNMCDAARWLVNDCGFDGVQWDYEPTSNPQKFLELLHATRGALPQGKWLSVASCLWFPEPFTRYGWSTSLYADAARYCDDIAVMGYDSRSPLPQVYENLIADEVVKLTNVIESSNPACRLIMGVPTYDRGFLHDHTENLRVAIVGVRNGLNNSKSRKKSFAGIAPFADYTTDNSEWNTYQQLWLCGDK